MNWHVKLLRSATALALITAAISGTNNFLAKIALKTSLVTNVLSAIFLTHDFNKQQILSALLFIFGSIIFIGFARATKFSINLDSTKPHGRFTTLH
jgi:hypothetical protein